VESTMPMMISVVTPFIAVLLGWVVLGETLPPQTFFGGLLIMASIAITIFKRKLS
jgi:drug/metabolite transporter (DMT)-like permease